MSKFKDKIIKLLGGFTKEEYKAVTKRHQKLLDETKDEQSIQLCNETTFRNLSILEEFAKSLYGSEPNEWAEEMYNVIHNNKMYVFLMHLSDPNSHIVYKVNPYIDKSLIREIHK